jgi:hypothetical protein
MKRILLFALLLLHSSVFAQTDNSDTLDRIDPNELARPIVAEGKRLYKSEMASWYGTDLFLERCKDKSKIGGYFSYCENDGAKCIFYSNAKKPVVIGSILFDSTFSTNTAIVDLQERKFTDFEKDLYEIRVLAQAELYSDTMFKLYKNTNFNLIPLIEGKSKKVYVLTGPKNTGVVIFGNDYLLEFDANNKLLVKKQLHQNMIPIKYVDEEGHVIKDASATHTHLPETGDFITATDVCTLMLYEKFAKWKQHTVVSQNYLNIWICERDELFLMTMEAVEKVNRDQEQRHPQGQTTDGKDK